MKNWLNLFIHSAQQGNPNVIVPYSYASGSIGNMQYEAATAGAAGNNISITHQLATLALPTKPSAPTFSGTIHYVGGSVGDYATLSAAISAASSGDIIEVRAGYTCYVTAPVGIDKSLEIRGQNRSTSLITTPPTTSLQLGGGFISLPQATLPVGSTANYPSSGTLLVSADIGIQTVNYTGKTSTSFTGCSGGTGQITNGSVISLSLPNDLLHVQVLVGAAITLASGGQSLPQSTIHVTSTNGLAASGTVLVPTVDADPNVSGWQTVTYTGKTATSITGCSGGTGIIDGPSSNYNPSVLQSVKAYIHTATLRNNTLFPGTGVPSAGSSCIGAPTMSEYFPSGASGLYFSNLNIVHPKIGISIQGSSFVIENCAFSCWQGGGVGEVFAVVNYGQTGDCFFKDCTVTANVGGDPSNVVSYVTAKNPNTGTFFPGHQGNYVLQNVVANNRCRSYYVQDVLHQPDTRNGSNYQNAPTPGSLGLWFDNCSFNGQWSENSITFVDSVQTTVAAGSNGQSLPRATVNVTSAASFPATGSFRINTSAGVQTVTYTGKTATGFTGCAGGTGTMSTGSSLWNIDTLNFFSRLYVRNCTGQGRASGYGPNKGFIAVGGSGGTNRLVGAPTVAFNLGGTNTFGSSIPAGTYAEGSTTDNLLGVLTTNFAVPSPLLSPTEPVGAFAVSVVGNAVTVSVPPNSPATTLASSLNADGSFAALVGAVASDGSNASTTGSVTLSGGAG